MINQSNFINEFIELENRLQLFDGEICGIKFWQLVRTSIGFKIHAKLNKLEAASPKEKESVKKNTLSLIKNYFKSYSQIKNITSYDILVLNHPRRIKLDDFYYDVYTDLFLDDLNYSYLVLENFYQLIHFEPATTKNLIYSDFFKLPARILSSFKTIKISKKEQKIIEELSSEIKNKFDVEIDIFKIIKAELIRYHYLQPRFKSFLEKLKPKLILEVNYYNRPNKIINVVAKELDIPTVELQHGFIGNFHLAYNFPKFTNNVGAVPDYLFVWGNYWKENLRLPIEPSNIRITGFPFLEHNKRKFHHPISKKNNKNYVLVISQTTIGKYLADIIYKVAQRIKNPSVKFIYKLHPSEINIAKDRYPNIYSLPNIEVIDNPGKNVYEFFNKSKIQIGVYSTAILEGLAFNLKTIILQLPGWEYYSGMMDKKEFLFTSDADKVINFINSNICEEKNAGTELDFEFWKQDSTANIKDEIHKIIQLK